MIADLKPYPVYKDSGLSRFEKVPAHWEIAPLVRIARLKSLANEPDRELLSVYLGKGVIRFTDVDEKRTNTTSEDLSKYQVVEPGDFVLNNQQAWRGSVGVSRYSGIVSPAYLVLALANCYLPEYADYLLRDHSMVTQYLICSKGVGTIQRNLYWPHLKRLPTIIPSKNEQAAIVRFLDWANGRLEQAIRAKRKIIALLAEQKQTIIHRAVTRGLDPTVRFKDSGIPWLGEIPEHWEVLRTRYLFREIDERSITGKECHLSMSQKLGLVPAEEVTSSLQSDSYVNGKVCKADDLVLNRLKAHLGVFAIAKQVGVISPDYSVFRKSRSINMKYYELILRGKGCRGELFTRSKGIVEGFWRLYTDDFYDIKLPLPPLKEQNEIASAIEIETKSIEIPIARLEREIELLREYRNRLVSDVVTGKLDVREAAERLPGEVQPEEIAEDGLVGDEEVEETVE